MLEIQARKVSDSFSVRYNLGLTSRQTLINMMSDVIRIKYSEMSLLSDAEKWQLLYFEMQDVFENLYQIYNSLNHSQRLSQLDRNYRDFLKGILMYRYSRHKKMGYYNTKNYHPDNKNNASIKLIAIKAFQKSCEEFSEFQLDSLEF